MCRTVVRAVDTRTSAQGKNPRQSAVRPGYYWSTLKREETTGKVTAIRLSRSPRESDPSCSVVGAWITRCALATATGLQARTWCATLLENGLSRRASPKLRLGCLTWTVTRRLGLQRKARDDSTGTMVCFLFRRCSLEMATSRASNVSMTSTVSALRSETLHQRQASYDHQTRGVRRRNASPVTFAGSTRRDAKWIVCSSGPSRMNPLSGDAHPSPITYVDAIAQ